jgi:curved DNA-binding protein CbpA
MYTHTDPDDPHAEETFKKIAIAYSTLMDPQTRHKYNEFGSSGGKGGADEVVDPEAVFSSLFGGEKFQDIIGTISLGQEMKAAMQEEPEEEEEEDEGTAAAHAAQTQVGQSGQNQNGVAKDTKKKKNELSPEAKARKAEIEKKQNEEREKARSERVAKLTEALIKKLGIFTEQLKHGGSVREVAQSGLSYLLTNSVPIVL